jgi:hypothetical protein
MTYEAVAFWFVMAGFAICLWRIGTLRRDLDLAMAKQDVLIDTVGELRNFVAGETVRGIVAPEPGAKP